jgi:hypothetical protein
VKGVPGSVRLSKNKVIPITSDRGPKDLSDMEGDFVHAVGLLIGSRRFAYSAFGLAVKAWQKRVGISNAEASRRLGIDDSYMIKLIHGKKFPSDELLCRLRTIICGETLE